MPVPVLIFYDDEYYADNHAADDEESKESHKDILDDFECFFNVVFIFALLLG
jgi:hypothetical protein